MSTFVDRAALVDALRALSRVTQNNPTLPVLANVAIDCEAGRLLLVTTNLDQYGRRSVTHTGDPLPSLTVSAKGLADFAAGFAGDTISLTYDEKAKRLRIASKRQKASLSVIERDNFPTFPALAPDAKSFTITMTELADLAAFVVPFAATDASRPILTGISVHGDGTSVRFAAADNYRVGTFSIDHATVIDTVLPAAAFALATRVLTGGDAVITVAANMAMFSSTEGVLVTRIIEGTFPNLDAVMPSAYGAALLVSRDEFASAAKLAALAGEVFAKFETTDEGLRVFAKDESRDFDTTLEAVVSIDVDGAKLPEFALAQKYVTAIAAAFGDATKLEVLYNDPLAPVAFADPDNRALRAVVMPVRSAR